MSTSSDSASPPPPSLKRKRAEKSFSELEVDVSLPEPPSKKALRKAKKLKTNPKVSSTKVSTSTKSTPLTGAATPIENPNNVTTYTQSSTPSSPELTPQKPPTRSATTKTKKSPSQHGTWIGNLPFTITKTDLTTFLTTTTSSTHPITLKEITRIHLPAPSAASKRSLLTAAKTNIPIHNKGFAYIDFTSAVAQKAALDLSETLLQGRRVLIKDSKDFEGRPEKKKGEDKDKEENIGREAEGKPKSRKIWVGNLGFDVVEEELRSFYERCGAVESVLVAKFQDSGKCKGFAFVRFEEVEAAEKAVRGWVEVEEQKQEGEGEDEGKEANGEKEIDMDGMVDEGRMKRMNKKKQGKKRRVWVNRLKGKQLRAEYAEDEQTRYYKRFGKGRKEEVEGEEEGAKTRAPLPEGYGTYDARKDGKDGEDLQEKEEEKPAPRSKRVPKTEWKERKGNRKPDKPGKRDARTIAPGAAHSAAKRGAMGIVQSQGKKIVF